MTTQLAPTPVFRAWDNQGVPLSGGKLFTYVAGTTTKQVTFTDSTGGTPNTNPVILNYRGEANVWLDPTKVYKIVLAPANDTDPPANPFWTVDQISGGSLSPSGSIIPTVDNLFTLGSTSFSWANVYVGPNHAPILDTTSGNIGYYARTAAEIAAAVTPTNFSYPPLTVDRYGTNTTPGTTVMTVAWQSAINVAKKNGGIVTWGPGPYLIDAALDLTNPVGSQNCMFALIGQGRFKAPTNSTGTTATPSILLKHTGHAFDTTGSQGIHFENMSIASIDNVNYPKTCFLRARNTDGASRTDRLVNCYVYGPFQQTIDANYGAEDDILDGCQFYNTATNASASAIDINGFNVFRAYASTFTTIATGSQSCLDHKIIGGEFANFGGAATSDVIRLTAARSVKIIGAWMDSSTPTGTVSGRSLIYVDAGNAASGPVYITGVDGEANAHPAQFAILFDGNAVTHPNWVVIGNIFPNAGSMLGGGAAGATLSQLTWINNTNSSAGGGVSFNGTISSSYSDNTSGGFVAGVLTNDNNTEPMSKVLSRNGEIDLTMFDTSQAVGSKGWRIRSVGTWALSTVDDAGNVTANAINMTRTGVMNLINKFYPGNDAGASQSIAGIYGGTGVPSNANGNNGDFYFRGDTPGTVNQRIYIKSAGAWVGIL